MEITYSKVNGWHVHFHCYYIFNHELNRSESADFAGTYAAEWVETAQRAGYAAPLAKNQKFEVIDLHKVSSIQAAAKYCTLSKTAVTPQTSKLGHELTNSQSKIGKIKVHGNGQKVLHLTYWDFIRILSDKSEQSEHTLSDKSGSRCRGYLRCTRSLKPQVCKCHRWHAYPGFLCLYAQDDPLVHQPLSIRRNSLRWFAQAH